MDVSAWLSLSRTQATTFHESVTCTFVRGVNAFLREHARNTGTNTFTSGSRSFDHNTTSPLGNHGLRALQGFFLSARAGVDRLLINISPAFAPFYSPDSIQSFISSSGRSPDALKKMLKGVKVRIDYEITGGPQPTTSCYRFVHGFGSQISLHRLQSQTQLCDSFCRPKAEERNHPLYPRILRQNLIQPGRLAVEVSVERRLCPSFLEWYPASVLRIVEFQACRDALKPDETSAMIKSAQFQPAQNRQQILRQGLRMFGIDPAQQHTLTDFGISTGTQMIKIPASWLDMPKVVYVDSQARVSDASWNLRDVEFFSTPGVTSLYAVNVSPQPQQSVEMIAGQMTDALRRHGILAQQGVQWRPVAVQSLSKSGQSYPSYEKGIYSKLASLPLQNPKSPVLVLIDSKHYEIYACSKRVAELRLDIRTIFCTTNNARRFQDLYASSIALEYNMESRGINHTLGPNSFKAIRHYRPGSSRADTIVIEADVTHPSASSRDGTPRDGTSSIAAVVGSTDDHFMHLPGSMRLQQARKEHIVEPGDMVKEWVSESQYDKVRAYETPQIQQAPNWAKEYLDWESRGASSAADPILHSKRNLWPLIKPKQVSPKVRAQDDEGDEFEDNTGHHVDFELTYVVVGKRRNTRFYPTRPQDEIGHGNGNVRPGLVVDQVITHPHSFDFYLQSHQPVKAMGGSARYFVLRNHMNLSTRELQEITHDFYYAYSRATKGVSYCAPAYYADRLCDRGRA